MKYAKIASIALALMVLTGCGTADAAEKTTGTPMTIRPTEFSAETKKVLEILDDEVMFFTYTTDDSVKSIDLALWFYENGEWVNVSSVKGNEEVRERDIVLRVKDTEIDLIQISDSGQNKYTYPVTQDFSGSLMAVEERLQNTEAITLEEEIVLYYKVATDENAIRSETDFREMNCTAGMALTVTFSGEAVE
ncbi:MAG: hypothetical protein IJ480_02380 [Clostridia bacterium]|nr:hypothetical protein [Clostridia bacterium]